MKKFPIFTAAIILLCWLLSTQYLRWGWVLLGAVVAVTAAVRLPNARKSVLVCAAVCAVFLIAGSLTEPWTELARFALLKPAYEHSAQSTAEQLEKFQGMSGHSEPGSLFLTSRGEILCDKDQGDLVLYYPIKGSFFNEYGFVYAPGGLEDSSYDPKQVDAVYSVDPCWFYVKVF